MLTKNSFVAINQFFPFVNPMKGHIKSLYNHFEKWNPRFTVTDDSNVTKSLTMSDLASEKYIDEHLKKDIIKLTSCREITFQTGKVTFTLQIYHKDESLDYLIDMLMYALSFTTMIGPHRINKVTMNIYLLDVKRVFDGDYIFDKEEVNGGSCLCLDTSCEIAIWRKEEILKVSIHELIHGLSYDYRDDTPEIVDHYQGKYGITSPKMNTFEAYTEIWAELIHSYLLARFFSFVQPTISVYDLFCANVGIEMLFSQYQSTKVLTLLDKNKDMNKETNVCAYYVIKTELYQDLDTFLGFCLQHNKDIVKITETTKYFDYLKGLPKVEEKKSKTNKYLRNTTRMTCLEIDLF